MSKQTRKVLTGQGRVLSFDQPGDFFLRLGMRRQDNNNLTEAAEAYQEAVRREPENEEYQLALAELLTQMCRFEESNRILFRLSHADGARPSECLFGMACNFIGLQEYALAQSTLEQYLNVDPEGEFVDDALDMLDALEEQRLSEGEIAPRDKEIQEACGLSKAYMEQGDARQALEALKAALEKYPEAPDLWNHHALARFCAREFSEAVRLAQGLLERYPDNLQAKCNLALFLNAQGKREQARTVAQELRALRPEDPDELNRLALTMMETGFLEDAYQLFSKLHRATPYDGNITHRFAVCCYELGRYKQAMSLYDRLRRLNPLDSVARYFRGVCAAAAAGAPHRGELPYLYQVPNDVVVTRVHQINDYVRMPHEELLKRWQEDERFRSLLLWALQLSDPDIKRAMLTLAASFQDRQAEGVLRDFVLDRSQPDELKKEVLGLLARMGARGPYTAYMGGRLVQGQVNYIESGKEKKESARNHRILNDCSVALMEIGTSKSAEIAFDLYWEFYFGMGDEFSALKKNQIVALTAALVYLACRRSDAPVTKASLCSRYDISLLRLNSAIGKLLARAKLGKERYAALRMAGEGPVFEIREETDHRDQTGETTQPQGSDSPEEAPPCE